MAVKDLQLSKSEQKEGSRFSPVPVYHIRFFRHCVVGLVYFSYDLYMSNSVILISPSIRLICLGVKQNPNHSVNGSDFVNFGARGGTRTHTSLRTLAPEASESTNSTTRASDANLSIGKSYTTTPAAVCQYSFSLFSPLRGDFSSARRGDSCFLILCRRCGRPRRPSREQYSHGRLAFHPRRRNKSPRRGAPRAPWQCPRALPRYS